MLTANQRDVPVVKARAYFSIQNFLTLGITHIDCDAFFAAIEKRDNPELEDKPVIIGGGQRGVVSTGVLHCAYSRRKICHAHV
jgi:hypothetical protein